VKRSAKLWLVLWLVAWPTGSALAQAIDEEAALRLALQHNATLQAATLQWRAEGHAVEAEAHRYGFELRTRAAAGRSESPTALDRRIQIDESKTLDLEVALDRRLSLGTVLSLSVSGNVVRDGAGSGLEEEGLSLGPTYALQTQLTLTQPLLRGAGRDVGEAELRRARLTQAGAGHARDRVALELMGSVLIGYWELWYAARALEIQRESHALLSQQYAQARSMVTNGALAEADALPFATRAVALEDAVVSAEAERQRRSVELAAAIGLDAQQHAELTVDGDPVAPPAVPLEAREALRAAYDQSDELEELRTTVELAREEAKIAGEPLRPRLDLEAAIGFRGLGDRDLAPPFEQLGRLAAVSGQLAAVFELPLDSTQRRGQVAAARLTADAAQARWQARVRQIAAAVRGALSRIESSERRVEVGRRAVSVATQLATAQQGRFLTGLGTALQVLEAQEELRSAQLRLLRAEADGGTASLMLAQLTGEPLRGHAPVRRALAASAR